MKSFLKLIGFCVIAIQIIITIGCEYEVAQPKWYEDPTPTVDPIITSVLPSGGAVAGVNTITIKGQNFGDSVSQITVFFNVQEADIISVSPTQLIVRRPHVVDPAAKLQVSSIKSFWVTPPFLYRVDRVIETYGLFLENIVLGALAFDAGDTLYVMPASNITKPRLFKIDPSGSQEIVSLSGTGSNPFYICIYGNTLYWLRNNRTIFRVNLTTRAISNWTQMPAGKIVRVGEFGSTGHFYAGGLNTDLCIVPPNPPSTLSTVPTANAYLTEEILSVRIWNNYLYVASRTTAAPATKIYRHLIGTGGSLGTRELILDLGTTPFASCLVKSLNISSLGQIFITTDAPNPLLIYDGNSVDYFYKELISYKQGNTKAYWLGKLSYWGNKNHLYMIGNDTLSTSDAKYKWNVLKIDMGTLGAPFNF